MKPKFLAHEDTNQLTIKWLRNRQPLVDVLTATEGGIIGLPDPEILRLAAASGRILITHDRGTMTAHFDAFIEEHESPGLIIVPQSHLIVSRVIDDLLLIWGASEAEEHRNQRQFIPF